MANTQSNSNMRPKRLPNYHPKLAKAAEKILKASDKYTRFETYFPDVRKATKGK